MSSILLCVWWCAHLSSLIPTSGSRKDWITSFSKLNCRLLNSRNNNHQVVNLTVWKRKSMAWKLGSKCSHMTTLFSVVRKLILAFYFPKQLLLSRMSVRRAIFDRATSSNELFGVSIQQNAIFK